jgi:hypothetical protein
LVTIQLDFPSFFPQKKISLHLRLVAKLIMGREAIVCAHIPDQNDPIQAKLYGEELYSLHLTNQLSNTS